MPECACTASSMNHSTAQRERLRSLAGRKVNPFCQPFMSMHHRQIICQRHQCQASCTVRVLMAIHGTLNSWDAYMDAESLFERLRDCSSGEPLGVDCRGLPLTAKRVASLGDKVSGTMSDLAGEGRYPALAARRAGTDALKPVFACSIALRLL